MTNFSFFAWHKSIMGTAIFSLGPWVIKLPCSIGGFREVQREWLKINTVKEDAFYQKYLPHYYKYGPILIINRLKPIEPTSLLIKEFLSELEKKNDYFDSIRIAELTELEPWNAFINKHLSNEEIFYWKKIITEIRIMKSSAHGDCHVKNMLTDGSSLYLVDWSNYQIISARIFDIITFYITKHEKSWTVEIFNFFENNKKSEKITYNFFIAYCVYRTSKELRELMNLNRLNDHQIRKYRFFLNNLKEFFLKNKIEQ